MSEKSFSANDYKLILDQSAGGMVQAINDARIRDEIIEITKQDIAFEKAITEINKVRDFISDHSKILGRIDTKHGEIAEHIEVRFHNAWEALAQKTMTANIEDVHRTGPVDYIIDGISVQSKFINGVNKNLSHVLDHLNKYKDLNNGNGFTGDGSYYIIPKDAYDKIKILLDGGHIDELRLSTEENITALIRKIESQTGKPFSEVVQSSTSNYSDVQVYKAPVTLDNEQKNLGKKNEEIKDKIIDDHKPSLRGAAQAALVGAAVGGSLSLATGLYAKYKAGRNVFKGDFSIEDWKEVGLDTATGTATGAVAAGSIYLMTNYAGMAAPFASAVVSAAKGLSSLTVDFSKGNISFDEFVDMGMIVCAESAIVGVSAAIGQAVIPVPVLGAIIGSLAGKMVVEFTIGQNEQIAQRLRDDMEAFKAKLEGNLQDVLVAITVAINRLDSITAVAFDFSLNSSLLDRSAELAMAYRVHGDKIIVNESALDKFMLS